MSIAMLLLGLVLGNDESQLDLAGALARRGWVDLAEEMCTRIEKNPPAGLPLVLAELSAAKARRETDVTRAVAELAAGIARLRSQPSIEARGMLGWLLTQRAKLLTGAAEDDPAFRAEALKAWEAVETSYRESLAELQKLPKSAALEEAILDARLELPKSMAAHARVAGLDEAPRKKLFDQAVALLLEFQLDMGASPIAFEAMIEEGRCRVDLGDAAKGERCFRGVLGMKRDPRRIDDYQKSLIHDATLGLIRALTLQKKLKEAIAVCRQAPPSPAMSLEEAQALVALSDLPAALGLLQKIVAQDPEGPIGHRARRLIQNMGGAGPGPLLLVAEGNFDKSRYRDALAMLRRCIESCATETERAKYEPIVAFKRGECYRALQRNLEAAVAYQEVFRKTPKHELAPRAAFEAVRSLSLEYAVTGVKRDQEDMEKLLAEVERLGLQGSFKDFFQYLQAEILERKGQLKAAAELYRTVPEAMAVYVDAMVSAGNCWRRDADRKWSKDREKARVEIVQEFGLAEDALRKAIAILDPGAGKTPTNPRLLVVACHELATICSHETIHRTKESLELLERCVQLLPQDSDAIPRLLETQVQAQLAAKDVDAAAALLEKMILKHSESISTARSARRVATQMEGSDPAKAWKYYRVWLTQSTPTYVELHGAADGLYKIARTLNRLEPQVLSRMDLNGKAIPERAVWRDAARALELLLTCKELGEKDAIVASSRLVFCYGFMAESAADWMKLKTFCEGLIRQHKLLDPAGDIDPARLQANGWLAGIYFEYGHALRELGKGDMRFQLGNALRVYNNLVGISANGSQPWWLAKYWGLRVLFERGEKSDLQMVDAALSLTETNHPGFEDVKFGMKEKYVELRNEVRAVTSPRR